MVKAGNAGVWLADGAQIPAGTAYWVPNGSGGNVAGATQRLINYVGEFSNITGQQCPYQPQVLSATRGATYQLDISRLDGASSTPISLHLVEMNRPPHLNGGSETFAHANDPWVRIAGLTWPYNVVGETRS